MKGLAYFLSSNTIQAKMSECQHFLCEYVCMCVNENLASSYLRTSLEHLQTLVCNLGLCHWHNKETGKMYYSLHLFFLVMNSTSKIVIVTNVSICSPPLLFLVSSRPNLISLLPFVQFKELRTSSQVALLRFCSVKFVSLSH